MASLPSDPLTLVRPHSDMRAFLVSAGYILGAASCCSDIDRPRILVAADRVNEIVAADKGDAQTCDIAFHEGVTAGTKAIGSGALDRAQADSALAVLERIIGR